MDRFFISQSDRRIIGKALFWVIALIAADQISKYWLACRLPENEVRQLLPFLSLYHTRNSGIAFSLLADHGGNILILLTTAIILLVAWLFWHNRAGGIWQRCGYILIIGGAIGNLIDRIRLHYVTDFILLHIGSWSFAVFNLADAFITLGVICILLHECLNTSLLSNK